MKLAFFSVYLLKHFTTLISLVIISRFINCIPHTSPSLSVLHYMYKKHPIMKLQQCMEATNQCQKFSSCKGVYLHLVTGECLFDNSKVKQTSTSQHDSLTTTKSLTYTSQLTTETTLSSSQPSTPRPFANTSINFAVKSTDHKKHTKLFDTKELSTCFWFKPKEEPTKNFGVLSIFQSPDDQLYCNSFFLMYKAKTIYFLRNIYGDSATKTETKLQLGETYHICFGWSIDHVVFYVNGVLDKIYENLPDKKLVANKFVVGNDLDGDSSISKCVVNDPGQSFLGEILDLNIWNRVLKDNEIENIYSNGQIPEKNLTVSWGEVLEFVPTENIKIIKR